MEFKLIQFSHPSTLIRFSLSDVKAISTKKHFHLHAQSQKGSCQIQGMSSNGQHSTEKDLVHLVKTDETLISISKLSGQKGEPTKSSESSLAGEDPGLGLYGRCLKQNIFTVQSFHHFSYAKTTGYFLVLVPLIAFCIRCLMCALHKRVAQDLKHNLNELEDQHPGSKRMRWKAALQELRDLDGMDTDISPDHDHLTEDQDEVKQKELSHNYAKLERDYAKFLSECGISKGYWRGGSPK